MHLTGQWGGRAIFLDAQGRPVQLRLACMRAVLPELTVDSTGHFEGTAGITWVSFGSDPTAAVLIAGDAHGADMTLTVTYTSRTYTDPEPDRYGLRLGAPGDFYGIGCLD